MDYIFIKNFFRANLNILLILLKINCCIKIDKNNQNSLYKFEASIKKTEEKILVNYIK